MIIIIAKENYLAYTIGDVVLIRHSNFNKDLSEVKQESNKDNEIEDFIPTEANLKSAFLTTKCSSAIDALLFQSILP